ncbi:uncharacterized protein LOC122086387 [Macadamia integrifolia]|uniref:uncharacterized protein LOC122086387 n=1 Tax=Macadamia integrifolia TaxID=60698 RepID=UPI001C4EFCD0|nr:uncharacterized protein LOC122086387 [Macadamia integrifolia]
MATRLFQRRIFTFFSRKQSHTLNGPSLHHLPSTTVLLNDGTVMLDRRRIIHSESEHKDEDIDEPRSHTSDTDSSTAKYAVLSNLKSSTRHDLAMIFTCKVCETRSVKTVCRESYEKGVVLARCGGCNNLHLIADRLGWFGEPGSIEDLLAARGEEIKKGSLDDTLNLTFEDLAGTRSTE